MSYNKTVKVQMTDDHLPHLEAACQDLNLRFHANLTRYMTHEGQQACEHVIEMEGQPHTIGVVREGDKLNLAADFYSCQRLQETVGDSFDILMQRTSVNMARQELFLDGAREIEEQIDTEDNRIRLVATY